jgi:hypothetical protein
MVDLASLKKLKEQQKTAEEVKPAELGEKHAQKKAERKVVFEPIASIEPVAKSSKPRQAKPRARRPKVEETLTTELQLQTAEGYVPGLEEWQTVYKLITGKTIRGAGEQIKKAVMATIDQAQLPSARHRGYHRSYETG